MMVKSLISFSLIFTLSMPAFGKSVYRFRNSDGEMIIKDQITNEMIAVGYDVLNDSGMLIERVPPGKTLEEEEQERLKKIEEKKSQYQLQQKIRNDAELLRQFSSIGDIIRTRDSQLLGLEQRIKIQNSKSNLLKLQLEDQQRQAATHERLGQKLPKLLEQDIAATHEQIASNQRSTDRLEDEKIHISKQFEGDIVRYKRLESLRMNLKQTSVKNDGTTAVIYDCLNVKDCQKAWQLAQIYANDNASGQIEIITNALILTSKPRQDADMSLSFSKIPAPDNLSQIVLEVSCTETEEGANLCQSDAAKSMRTGYLKLLENKIK